jgi:hypothetical protein
MSDTFLKRIARTDPTILLGAYFMQQENDWETKR